MTGKKPLILLLFLVLVGAAVNSLSNLGVVDVSAVPLSPYIMIIPEQTVNSTITPGMNYTISIYTDYSGSDIWLWQFELFYNPYVLEGLEVRNGDLITTAKDLRAEFFPGTFDNTVGHLDITLADFYPVPKPPPTTSGPGILANVTFRVKGTGISNITLGEALLQGYDADTDTWPFIIYQILPPGATQPPYGSDHIGHGHFNNIPNIHDVAVASIVAPSTAFLGENVTIDVTVANEGNYTESVIVRVSYNAAEIGTESFTLVSGLFNTLVFSWSTKNLTQSTYTITAEAILDGDADPIDNSATTTVVVSGTLLSVPYHHQITGYYCGPASLEMVFDYYGPDISQLEIADAARTSRVGTGGMVRPAHFSNLSTSKGGEMPGNVTGYTARTLGYAAFYPNWPFTLDDLKTVIDAGYPIIVATLFSQEDPTGHSRVVVGYNATHVILHDPWPSMGPMLNLTTSEFLDLWYCDGLFVSPWEVTISAPQNVQEGDTFTVTANVTYPCPTSFSAFEYPASMTNATIILPEGMSLDLGETAKKLLGTGNLPAGNSVAVSWKVKADSSGDYEMRIEAAGKVNGWFFGDSYEDRIGGNASSCFTVAPVMIPPGMAADLVGRKAWPEHRHYDINKDEDHFLNMYALVGNTGNVTIPAEQYKVVWTITPLDTGALAMSCEATGTVDLAPRQRVTLMYKLSAFPVSHGHYQVKAYCYYYGVVGETTKTFRFSVKPCARWAQMDPLLGYCKLAQAEEIYRSQEEFFIIFTVSFHSDSRAWEQVGEV